MKKINFILFLILITVFKVSAQTTIFYEDFINDSNGNNQTGSITNWNILSGNIDVSNTYIQYSSYTGKSIDLAGLVNGTIETKNSITFTPGTYKISFLAKDNTFGNSNMKMDIGNLFNQNFQATNTAKPYSATFTVETTTSVKIKLSEVGPSNEGGTFIGDIRIENICPTTIFYEDFTADANESNKTGSTTNWNILSGNVDISDTYLQFPSYTGKAMDLAGLVNGTIETKSSFDLTPGTYTLSFLAKYNTYNNSDMLVQIGNAFSQNFKATSTVQEYKVTFNVVDSEKVKIKLSEVGPSNPGGTFFAAFKLVKDCSIPTSITDDSKKDNNSSLVYPNPSNGTLHIEAPENSNLELISIEGQTQQLINNGYINTYQLDVKPGMYLLKISNSEKENVEFHKILITE